MLTFGCSWLLPGAFIKTELSKGEASMTLRKGKIQAKPADSGQTLVEFAIAAMVFLLLLFATIDFGYLYYVKVTLQNAVRQGTGCPGTDRPVATGRHLAEDWLTVPGR